MASSEDKSDLVDLLSVSVGTNDTIRQYSTSDHLYQLLILILKYGLLVGLLALNFLGLSVSLNCNANEEFGTRIFSAIFAFFFGFVYLLVNYYTYRVLIRGKICPMNRDKLFPF